MNIRRPVPLWALLVTILVSGAVAATVVYFPRPPGPDFNLTSSSNPVLVQAGSSNTSVVKVESVRGFLGVVSFGIISPNGLTAKLSDQFGTDQNQVVLGAVGNLTLRAWATAAIDYSVRIVATGGPSSHYVDLVVRGQDLATTTNTTSLTVARGASGTIGISLKSLNRLSGNVTLQSRVCYPVISYCAIDTYVMWRLTPSNVILPPGGSATVILTVTVSSSDSPGVDRILLSANRNSWGFYLQEIQLTIV
jgi:hypothetical protein